MTILIELIPIFGGTLLHEPIPHFTNGAPVDAAPRLAELHLE
jgi:hypothetical protein